MRRGTTEPPDPRHCATAPFRPRARRALRAFGATVELVLVPDRAGRPGVPSAARPAFRTDPVPRIVAEESVWRGDGASATPNRYPFAEHQLILWQDGLERELGLSSWRMLCGWVDRISGTGLVNTIGAAASIPRAHAHLTAERLPFLEAIGEERCDAAFLPRVDGVEWLRKKLPFWLLGARGAAAARAEALFALQAVRATAACNVVVQDGTAWVYPRSAVETPVPWFPWALGAAEVWGRWCYVEEPAFESADGDGLEQALVASGVAAG